MAGTVAYVSVSGLLKVFTGAGTMGLILFSSIEIAKIVGTSAIHTYGKRIGWFYSSLLGIMIVISMAITSMGIYGFLSSSYKASFAKMENVDAKVELLESKLDGYEDQLTYVISEKETLNITIGELSKGLSNNVIQYKDPETGEIMTTTSSSTRRALEKQLDNAILRQGEVNIKADSLSAIVFDLENQILETKLDNESASELSTLKYLSDITGKTMDEVMSWFILLLIIIGDPMAVLLVIVFNKVVNNRDKKDVGGLPMDSLIGGEPNKPLTDDEIVEKARKINLKNIFKKAAEISKLHPEEDEGEEEPTALAFTYPPEQQEEEEEEEEELLEELVEDEIDVVEDKPRIDTQHEISLPKKEVVEELIENTPEEQIVENVEEVKQLKREPIVPRGKIIEEDVIKNRGFSVDIPDPKSDRIGSGEKVHLFPRQRPDVLGNE